MRRAVVRIYRRIIAEAADVAAIVRIVTQSVVDLTRRKINVGLTFRRV